MFRNYAFFVVLCGRMLHAVAAYHPDTFTSSPSAPSGYFKDMWYLYKVYHQCIYQDIMPCLKQKLATTVNRLVQSQVRVPLLDGVYFVKNVDGIPEEDAVRNGVQRSLEASDDQSFISIFTNGVYDFLKTRIMEIDLPSFRELDRQARKKPLKKLIKTLPIMLATAIGGALSGAFHIVMMSTTVVMPVIIGFIAFLAIIVGKVALVLGGLVGINTMMEQKHETVHLVNSEGHTSYETGDKKLGSWGRDTDQIQQAQNIVYSSYIPPNQIHR